MDVPYTTPLAWQSLDACTPTYQPGLSLQCDWLFSFLRIGREGLDWRIGVGIGPRGLVVHKVLLGILDLFWRKEHYIRETYFAS